MKSTPRIALSGLTSLTLATLLIAAPTHAETTLYLGLNGGNNQQMYADRVLPAFEKANKVKVLIVPGTSADTLAKVQASRDKPPIDVMFLDDGVMHQAIAMGLCEKLQPSEALSQLPAQARIKDEAAAVSLGITGIGYNSKLFAEQGWDAPTSWRDLADSRYRQQILFQSLASSTFGLHAFLMFNRLQGGSETNVEPGFNAWPASVSPNVFKYIASSANIADMIDTDQIALFPSTPTLSRNLKDMGIAVEYVSPKEGGVVLNVAECVVAGSSQPELAQQLAAYLLTPEAQAPALEFGMQIPSNPNTPSSDKTREQVAAMHTYLQTAVTIDWDQVNKLRPGWSARWNSIVER